MKASELILLLQEQIAEHGDGIAQLEAHGSWLMVANVASFKGRTIVRHEPVALFPFHQREGR